MYHLVPIGPSRLFVGGLDPRAVILDFARRSGEK